MHLILDESSDNRLIPVLEAGGHDVVTIARLARAAEDETVLALALRLGRVLITRDPDFGELIVRYGHTHAGVVLMRLPNPDLQLAVSRLQEALRIYESLNQPVLMVVTDALVRIRWNQ